VFNYKIREIRFIRGRYKGRESSVKTSGQAKKEKPCEAEGFRMVFLFFFSLSAAWQAAQ